LPTMQIRVLPESTLPAIIFSLSLPELSQDISVPQIWDIERQRVIAEDLDIPRSIYAFDKSSWISAIVQDVHFDMSSRTISVFFQDNSVEEWPLTDQGCIRQLRNLLNDVRVAAEEERAQMYPSSPPSTAIQTTPGKAQKHKKKSSLLHFVTYALVSLLHHHTCLIQS
jgi:hypothetical protein